MQARRGVVRKIHRREAIKVSISQKEENPFEQFLRCWRLVRLYRWWIALGTFVIGLACMNAVFMLQDYYQATTTILVDPQQIPDRYVTSTVVDDPSHRLNTISQQVLSATRLQQIIEQFHLYPNLRGKMAAEQLVSVMVKDIDIKVKDGGSSLSSFTITYTSTNPRIVAEVTNQLASGFIEWNLKNREQVVTGTTDFLKSQLEKARQDLKDQEQKLSEFKLRHAGELPEDQAANLQMLSQLQSSFQANREALNRFDMQRTMLLHSKDIIPATGKPSGPLSERAQLLLEERDVEQKLAELRRIYTAEYPDIRTLSNRLSQVKERLRLLPSDKPEEAAQTGDNVQLSLVDREIARLNQEQKQIQSQMGSYHAKMAAAPIMQQQLLDLTRNYQVSSSDYASLLEKTSSSQLAADLEKKQKGERFTILDSANIPGHPFKPNRRMLIPAVFWGALCLSIALVIGKDVLTGALLSEHDLAAIVPKGVPVLAVVPEIQTSAALLRRKLIGIGAMVIVLLVCGAEVLLILKIKPII